MDCKYFDGCSAPLCPRDEGVADRTWFAGHSTEPQGEGSPLYEDICRLADVPEWVRRQRKVSRKAALGGYFTLAMLEHDCQIRKGMKGIDPDGTDRERAAGETAWFKEHPVMTAEERQRRRITGLKNKGFINGKGCEKDRLLTGLDEVSGKKSSWISPAGNGA
jgi:hypothetical protein